MDRYGIKLGVPSFCVPGLHAKLDRAAAPGPVGRCLPWTIRLKQLVTLLSRT
jgi:hypothetical protein